MNITEQQRELSVSGEEGERVDGGGDVGLGGGGSEIARGGGVNAGEPSELSRLVQ